MTIKSHGSDLAPSRNSFLFGYLTLAPVGVSASKKGIIAASIGLAIAVGALGVKYLIYETHISWLVFGIGTLVWIIALATDIIRKLK